jgi:quinol-cytochrome oxidoreductase complex cytochrome b subunit
MFAWIGKKGFMRGPVWFLFFIGCIAIVFADIMAIAGQFEPEDTALFVVVSVLAVLYIIAYIIAPKQFKPLWEKKRAELIEKKMSKGKK